MLVLSRKADEAIVIGGTIRVVVLQTGKGKVKLGIEAPDDCQILREELPQQAESLSGGDGVCFLDSEGRLQLRTTVWRLDSEARGRCLDTARESLRFDKFHGGKVVQVRLVKSEASE